MKKILIVIAAAAIVSCNSTGKSGSSDSGKTDTSAKKSSATTGSEKKSDVDSSLLWKYLTDTDKMTSKLRYFASVSSTNKLNFQAPYDGGSTAAITLRNQENKNEAILTIDKGQFICSVTDGCVIKVRFDNDPAISFKGSGPSDDSSTTLFIEPASKFIAHAKKAKKMIVQAEFYEDGVQDMIFNVDGLNWAH